MESKSHLHINIHKKEENIVSLNERPNLDPEKILEYKKGAITYQNIVIVPLEGQELTIDDLKTKKFWTTDPYPNLESTLLQNVHNKSIGNSTSFFGGETKLWQYINKTATSIKNEDGINLDIYNLTPTEAVFLVKEIVRRELSYDELMVGGVTEEHINKNGINTARTDILNHFSKNKNRFDKESTSYIASVDSKTADQILDHGYAICRHIAAVSSVLYESIRKKQQSIIMNGSYLIYHDEALGDQSYKASVGEHAFNILFVTHPSKNKSLVQTSVIDPTYIIRDKVSSTNPDHTVGRISQCCSSLSEIGYLFDIDQADITKISDISADKIKKHLLNKSPIFYNNESKATKDNLVSDYLSLAFQGTARNGTKVLDSLYEIYKSKNKTREEMVENILLLPPLTYQSDKGNKCIRKIWIPELIKQLQMINFKNKNQTNTGIIMIIEHMVSHITAQQLYDDKQGFYMDLLTEYNRIINV